MADRINPNANLVIIRGPSTHDALVTPVDRAVMASTAFSAKTKAVYAYFASMIANEPHHIVSQNTVLEELGLKHGTYEKYLSRLIRGEHITRGKSRNPDGSVTVFLYVTPCEQQETLSEEDRLFSEFTRKFRTTLRNSAFRACMQDRRLPLQAKAFYAYILCQCDSNGEAALYRHQTLSDLGIGKNIYNASRGSLERYGYLKNLRFHADGKLSGNLFRLTYSPTNDSDTSENRLLVITTAENNAKRRTSTHKHQD